MFIKNFLITIIGLNLLAIPSFSYSESKLSPSLSRMEREWLHREFIDESDELRISRLEEKVFGTIHDIEIKARYKQLQKAFDTTKRIKHKNKYRNISGMPTSIPITVDELIN